MSQTLVYLTRRPKETHGDLGLIPQSYFGEVASEDKGLTNWQRFAKHVERLNQAAPDGETYKVLFVTRHGQGYHNVMEAKVGTPAWEVRTPSPSTTPARRLTALGRANGRSSRATAP